MITYRARTLVRATVGLVLLAALGLYAYFGVYRAGLKRRQRQAIERLVFPFDKERLTRVEIAARTSRTVLERTGIDGRNLPQWKVVAPVEAEADNMAVNALLSTLELMERHGSIPADEQGDPDSYGLAPARGKISLDDEGGESFTLLVGARSEFSGQLYVKLSRAEEIYLVDGELEDRLLKTTLELRNKKLAEFHTARLARLFLSRGDSRLGLERSGGGWRLVEPIEARADEEKVRKLLNVISNLRAISFPDPGQLPSGLGLDPPQLEIGLELGAGEEIKFLVGQAGEKVYARRTLPPGPVIGLRPYVLSALSKKPFDLRFTRPLEFVQAAVREIRAKGSGNLTVIEKRPARDDPGADTWYMVSPAAVAVQPAEVRLLLGKLAALEAVGLVPTGKESQAPTLDNPVLSLALSGKKGKKIGWLRVGGHVPGGVLAAGSAQRDLCVVERKKIEEIEALLSALDSRRE